MKKVLFYVLAVLAYCTTANAQSIIDADDQSNPNDFYTKVSTTGKKPMPYPPVRQSDVIWEKVVWREIDFNERFNQFFYFPTNDSVNSQGRTNLVSLILRAVKNGEISNVYDDDDMKAPKDPAKAISDLAGEPIERERPKVDADGQTIFDEDGEPEMEKWLQERTFDITTATKIRIKERWYIDKQDSRQKVRILGLAFEYDKELASGNTARNWSFWIPMNDMAVRNVLVNADAFDENNDVVENSYDDVFIARYFDSYIIRTSNIHNRSISDYLVGEDAILEAQKLEEEIYDIESDMWEY
ncbi:MAG: gliding motility protein GldN [Bacteroidales bacterium]|jgi:gliding motility associated protien GldN|nr:gliding motility protein GldN [Bacteroidales bacterium]